jgi:hypothetical protein
MVEAMDLGSVPPLQIMGWKEHPEFFRSLCWSLLRAAFEPKS